MSDLIFLLSLSFTLSFFVSLFIIRHAKIRGILLDKDSANKPQKFHYGDIPRAGGVGIVVALIFGVVFKWQFGLVLIPLFIVFLSGFLEDLHGSLLPLTRLFLQSLGAILAVLLLDCVILDVGFALPYAFGVAFSVFCIVGIINAINIIDGFNGLAAGVAMLVLFSILWVSFSTGRADIFYLSIALLGGLLGFFVLNFPHGKIFLGDGGAYSVGFLLAFLLISLTQSAPENVPKVSAWYGLCVMVYPFFEVIFSIYRKKIVRKTAASAPDGIHFHMIIHRRITRSNPKTAVLLWLFNAPFILIATLTYSSHLILCALSLIFCAAYVALYRHIVRFGRVF